MKTLKVKTSKTADPTTCDYSKVSKEMLLTSSLQHIEDVRKGLGFFKSLLSEAADNHDCDKVSDIDGFHRDFITGFDQRSWWKNHKKISRHHLLQEDALPENVNLIDVLETIADCVLSGMARTGTVTPLNISKEILLKAFENTVELLKDEIFIEE